MPSVVVSLVSRLVALDSRLVARPCSAVMSESRPLNKPATSFPAIDSASHVIVSVSTRPTKVVVLGNVVVLVIFSVLFCRVVISVWALVIASPADTPLMFKVSQLTFVASRSTTSAFRMLSVAPDHFDMLLGRVGMVRFL